MRKRLPCVKGAVAEGDGGIVKGEKGRMGKGRENDSPSVSLREPPPLTQGRKDYFALYCCSEDKVFLLVAH